MLDKLQDEIKKLNSFEKEDILNEKLIRIEQCLFCFPHPSGANGHRKIQFVKNKANLLNIKMIILNKRK